MTNQRTFQVDSVPVCREKLRNAKGLHEILVAMKAHGVEGSGMNTTHPMFDPRMNPFLGAIHQAYQTHFPLVLSPDDVWTTIAQGFAMHVNENAEALRERFVGHEGKKDIVVDIPYSKGDPNLPWGNILAEFSRVLGENLGPKQRDLVVSNFSTTGVIEKAASEIVLMGAMQKYFGYVGRTLCGIPEITLLGTPEDWQSVKDRASALSEYDLGWWTEHLIPHLDQFVRASKGDVEKEFWKRIYKIEGGSGGPYISGWAVDLFPYFTKGSNGVKYVESPVRNRFLGGGNTSRFHGATTDVFPMGMTRVPWKWDYLGTMFDMEFLGGFVGISQDPDTFAVRPVLAWAVRDTTAEAPKVHRERGSFLPEFEF